MIVNQATIAPVRRENVAALGSFIADTTHRVSISAGLTKGLGVEHAATISLPLGVELKALRGEGLTDSQRIAIEKGFVNLSNATLPQIKKHFPEISGPVEGIELILAGKAAFDAWSDPERKTIVKPMIKSTRALFELIDVIKPLVPALHQVPYLDAACAAIKVGDSVWQFYCDASDALAKPKSR
jgi:hypothetical protein